ncbi:hypothetical protein IWW48_002398 [Coemansia sp. RSA 1200]|nr:hypothetical protein IWW48_002398 [Coemansia sp. RSA 1200]
MRGQQQAGMSAGLHMRPQQRPQVSFGPGAGASSVDPSRWLVETMSKLPSDQQERLAGLFRGLQSKTIDFPMFMRDAKVIMGTKFQDLLVLMHNQGMRPANMGIGPQQQQHRQASNPMARPNNPFSGLNVRPGIPHMSSTSLQMPTSQGVQRNPMQGNPLVGQGSVPDQQILDSSRNNMALMRQLLASQQAHDASTGGSGNTSVSKDTLSASLPASAYQNSQSAMMAAAAGSSGQDASVGNMGGFPAGSMGGVTPETLIARWRQIILNPVIPVEQLARLSMQLSSFGNLLASSTGPMAHMSEEARNQQFVQITKLQALIAQRQFARGSQAQKPTNSQPESRPESPKPEKKNKEPKKKVGAKATKEGGMPVRPKKRASESRRSGSPAPRPLSKKQKTGASTQSEADMDALTTQLALAGPSLSLDNISSISAARGGPGASGNAALVAGLTALQADEKDKSASYVDADSDYDNDSNVDYEDEDDTPISTSLIRGGISRTESLGTGTYNSDAEQEGNIRGKDGYKVKGREREVDSDRARAGDKPRDIFANKDKERAALKDTQRKYKEKREKDRGGAGGSGDVFSIHDVIGYTGVDLREESEIILGSGVHDQQDAYKVRGAETGYTRNASPLTRVIDGVEVSRTRSRETSFANSSLLEVLVSRSCKRLGIRAVSADVVPYLSLALQERLRSFMEMVSAAAYHRTKTQTLPPPPLDPSTRLPLYKITPHLDVKKQLLVLERIDKMKEHNRQKLLKEREQSNAMDPLQQADGEIDRNQGGGSDERRKLVGSSADQSKPESALGASASSAAADTASTADNNGIDQQQSRQTNSMDTNDASKTAAGAKRSRKRDDSATESPAYTSKNMPDDIRNKISNQTALRAAGGVRKSWMNASSANWLGGASAGKPNARPVAGPRIAPQHPADTADPPGSATSQADDSLRSGGGLPLPNSGSQMARRTASISSASGSINNISSFVDASGSTRSSLEHRRNRSSASNASDFDSVAVVSPAPEGAQTPLAQPALLRPPFGLLPHRSTTLAAPLLVTVRDCLFSLERERLGSARAGRGSGDRVLIQAYTKYLN